MANQTRNTPDPRTIEALLRVLAESPIPIESYESTAEGSKFTFFRKDPALPNGPTGALGGTPDEDGWTVLMDGPGPWNQPAKTDDSAGSPALTDAEKSAIGGG